jgi:hypothetical protein
LVFGFFLPLFAFTGLSWQRVSNMSKTSLLLD